MATATRKSPAKRARKATATKAAATPAVAAAPAPAKAAKPVKAAVPKKPKRIRGAFTMPEADYARIAKLKATAKRAGMKVKKNELLRLGLQALQSLSYAELEERILALRLPDRRAKA